MPLRIRLNDPPVEHNAPEVTTICRSINSRLQEHMPKYTYSDVVRARPTADDRLRPNEKAWVVGVIENRVHFPLKKFPPGVIYTIEFEDGVSVDAHEDDLLPA